VQPTVATATVGYGPVDDTRRVRAPKRKPWRRQDRRFRSRRKLPNVIRLTKQTLHLLIDNWKVVGGIVLIYGLLTVILVRGLNGGTNVNELKQQFSSLSSGAFGHVAAGFSVFALLLTSSNSASGDTAGAYQTLLLLIVSLAIVWVFRQRFNNVTVKIRESFYNGMYPLIPVVLVLLVVALQLLPLLIGVWLFSIFVQSGIATNGIEQLGCGVLLIIGASLTFYMLCSSLFALYIVTLPGMAPLKALRSARELVRYRRWQIIRKLLFLPLVLLIAGSLIMLPFILFAAVIAQWVFFLLTMAVLAAINGYMYVLYRELLHE
jgi:hypothetical protein